MSIGAATLAFRRTDNVTVPNAITGTAATSTLAINGGAFVTLSATGNTIGTVTLGTAAGGVLDIGANGLSISNTGGNVVQASVNSTINGTGGGILTLSSGTAATDGGNFGAASGVTLTVNTPVAIPTTGGASGAFELFSGASATGVTVLNGISAFTRNVIINSGVLSATIIGNSGSLTSNLGAGSTVRIGNGTGTGHTLRYTGSGETSNRVIDLSASTGAGIIGQSGTGALRFTSAFTATGAGAKTLTLGGSTAGTGEIAAAIVNSTAATSVLKTGTGTWTLSGTNTYTGTTTAGGGNLILNFAAPTAPVSASNIVSATSPLAFSGGTLTVNGSTTTATSQTFASTALNAGGGQVVAINGGAGAFVALGAISRPAAGGSLNVVQPSGTLSATNGVTTTTANVNGIIGGYATVGGVDYAVSGGAANVPITAFTGYTALPTTGGATTVNYSLAGAQTQAGATVGNVLKITDTGASQSLALGANALTFNTTGGILYAGGTANAYTISGTGVVGSGTGEVVVSTASGTNLTVTAMLVGTGAGGLTKTGGGTLTLGTASSQTNLFTGAINVNGGLLSYVGSNSSAYPSPLGSGVKNVNLNNGGGIQATSTLSNQTSGGVSFVIGSGGGVVDARNGATLQLDDAGQFSGTGTLIVQGAGTGAFYLNNQPFVFTGNVNVNSATLRLGTNSVLGTAAGRSITVASGAVLDLNNSGLILPLTVTLNGTGIGGGGSLIATAAYTLNTPVTLAGNASVGGTAALTLSGGVGGAFALTKVGTNTLTLSGLDTYTGGTTITAGTLLFNSPQSVPATGAITLPSTGVLGLNNFATADIAGTLTSVPVGSAGVIALSGTSGAANVNFANYPSLSLGAIGTVVYTGTYTPPTAGGTTRLGGGGGTLTFNQAIPSGALVVAGIGGGTTVLGGSNALTGITVANGNVISVGSDADLGGATTPIAFQGTTVTGGANGSGLQVTGTALTNITSHPVAFTNSAAFTLDINNAANTFTLDKGVQVGAAGFTKTGAGTAVLTGNNNFNATTVSGGTLRIGSATAISTGVPLTLSGTGSLDLNGRNLSVTTLTDASTTSIVDTGTGTGTDTLTVSAQAAAVNSLISNGTTRTVAVQLANGTTNFGLLNNGNTFAGGLTLLNNTNGTRLSVSSNPTTIGAPGAITSSPFGTGAITIGQSASDKAGIYFTAANSTVANAIVFNTALGNDRPGIRSDAAGTTFSGTITANYAPALFSSNSTTGSFNLTGQVTGPQGLVLDVSTTGTPTNATLVVTLNNATASPNNYRGDTVVNRTGLAGPAATLRLGANDQIPNGAGFGNVVVNSTVGTGTLDLNGKTETINGLSGSGGVTSGAAGAVTLTLGDGNATAAYTGVMANGTGAVSVTKIGTGVQTFGGANSYTGTTTVSAGQLAVTGAGTLAAASNLSVASGAAFTYAPTAAGNLTQATVGLAGGSTVNLGYVSGGGVSGLVSAGPATTSGVVNIGLSGSGTTGMTNGTYTLLSATSGLTSGGATYNVLNPTNFTFSVNPTDTSVQITTASQTALTDAFWIGGLSGNPTVLAASDGATSSNWATTVGAAASDTALVPGSGATVTFSATTPVSAATGLTLGASMSVAGLTFRGSNNVSIVNDGNVLTVGATGITTATTAGTVSLWNNFALGAAQTWTNNNTTNPLAVSGNVNTNGNVLTLTGPATTAINVSGVIAGTGGVTKTAAGTATLSGVNNYSGATTVSQGTLAFAADQLQLSASALTIGGTAVSGATSTVATTTGALDLSTTPASATFASLTVASNSATANTITVGSGKTLTVLGNVTLGVNLGTTTNAGNTSTSDLTVSGAGNVVFAGGTTNVGVAQGTQLNTNTQSTLDLTGLNGSFSFAGTAFNVGLGQTAAGTVMLANTANTIVTTTLSVGDSSNLNGGGGTVTLGTGTNVLQADTINIGAGRSAGTLAFALTTGPGTLTIANRAGTGGATISVGNTNGAAVGTAIASLLELRGHASSVTAAAVSVGTTNNAGAGTASGTIRFDTGTFTATSLLLGNRDGVHTGTGVNTADLVLGGGTFTVSGATTFAQFTATGTTAAGVTGTITQTAGAFTTGSIVGAAKSGNVATASTAAGNITLSGGTFAVSGSATMATNAANVAGAYGSSTASYGVTAGTFTVAGTLTGAVSGTTATTNSTAGATAALNVSGTGAATIGAIQLASKTGNGLDSATGTIVVSGGSLAVTGSTFVLATQTGSGTAVGSLNISGTGTVTTAADITDGGGATTTTLALTGAGATLNMGGRNLGSATTPIDTVSFTGGTLNNVGIAYQALTQNGVTTVLNVSANSTTVSGVAYANQTAGGRVNVADTRALTAGTTATLAGGTTLGVGVGATLTTTTGRVIGTTGVNLTGLTAGTPLTISLTGELGLVADGSYSLTVISTPTTNGLTYSGTNTFDASFFSVTSDFGASNILVTGNNNAVVVSFTAPVPEPGLVLGMAAGWFGIVNFVRRRRAAGAGV